MKTELARRRWNLTQREAELLVHLASGASNKTLAASLDRAVRTIEQHVTTLLEKMRAENRATAIARFWSELGGWNSGSPRQPSPVFASACRSARAAL
jgi:DNA-binding NarL/FixJ family response regulator